MHVIPTITNFFLQKLKLFFYCLLCLSTLAHCTQLAPIDYAEVYRLTRPKLIQQQLPESLYEITAKACVTLALADKLSTEQLFTTVPQQIIPTLLRYYCLLGYKKVFMSLLQKYATKNTQCIEVIKPTKLNLSGTPLYNLDDVILNITESQLRGITSLDLRKTELSGTVTIKSFVHLATIFLGHNRLETLTIIDCPDLTHLDAAHNELTRVQLATTSYAKFPYISDDNLFKVQLIRLTNNKLTTLSLTNCPYLQKLNLKNNSSLETLSLTNVATNVVITSNSPAVQLIWDRQVQNTPQILDFV